MKKNVKRSVRRIIPILVAVCITLSSLPLNVYAWKNLTHVTSANLVLLELLRSNKRQIKLYAPYGSNTAYTYTVPGEYYSALEAYPEAFRAGSMGPDFFPDMLTGQGYIHPYDKDNDMCPGEWITLLCNSVNMMPEDSEQRQRALAFTLGFMLHYCGDIFAHDFVNQFAGGTYPSLTDVNFLDSSDRNLNIMLSHMSEETYVDEKVNWDFYKNCGMLNIAAPIEFVSDTMLYNGTENNGSAEIYNRYGSVPAIYVYLIKLRTYLYNAAEKMRTSCDPVQSAAVMYLDAWIEDLDKATVALVQCFNNMADKMVTVKEPDMVNIVTEEILAWFDDYGKYITPLPDVGIDLAEEGVKTLVEEAIGGFDFIKEEDKDEWIAEQIKSLALTAMGIAGLDDMIKEYSERINDPEVQLDFSTNPFAPRDKEEHGNFKEFNAFVSSFASEQSGFDQISYDDILNGKDGGALDKALDSDLEAFYNTLVMFKLILIGPDNFSDFISRLSGVDQTQYQKNTAELYATSLELDIKTADKPDAGTDDNIFAVVYDKDKSTSEPVIKKLLDKSGTNDFESGTEDNYTVELGKAVKLSNIEVDIQKESTGTAAPDWDCESITITPYHAGAALTKPIGFGGRYEMKNGDTWKLCFHDELMLRTQVSDEWDTLGALSADVTIETDSDTGAGTDDDVFLEIYNGTSLIKSIPLDKADYNDFEAGCRDTYKVPLADNLNDTIPLEKLNMKIRCEGDTAGGTWDVKSVDIILCHGELQLTDTISRGSQELHNSTWDLDISGDIVRKPCSYTSFTLSYTTDVDDGMLNFVYSLDNSHQYANSHGLLWGNATVRKEVFFKVFKGFSPDIEYVGDQKLVNEGSAFNMDFTLEGMWNGTGQSRRNKVYFNSDSAPDNDDAYPTMPEVNGTATISFIDSSGSAVCSVNQTVSKGTIQLSNYKNDSLTAGTYKVKVTYSDNSSNPMYADAEEVFADKLNVVSHTHSFTYTASEGTITATCSADDCMLPSSSEGESDHVATLTISAPTLTTYGQTGRGISAEAVITDENSIRGEEVVRYYKATKTEDTYTKTGDALTAAPTDAGDYVAEITLSGVTTDEGDDKSVTASVGYTIAKADPVANAPTGLTAVCGQTLADVTLKNPDGNTDGIWKWEDDTTSVGSVGGHIFKAGFTPTDTANYNSVSNVDVTVTVDTEKAAKTKPVLKVTTAGKKLKAGALRKKAKKFRILYEYTGDGKVKFTNKSAKKVKSRIKVTGTGRVKVKKGTKKGLYRVKVLVRAAATAEYKTVTANKVIKVRVR